ncbi:hypothetical protein [Geodermatophilus maliterrae]|uniref:Uncharacterized protein n=1 Tax=Geodermatophilus maliterrae TaxID=3162531 RepID=A0ABV3XJR4_9ACTN
MREEVLRAWQSVRVAGSFLPVYGGLPRSTQVVPSEILRSNGTVDERSVAPLLEISLPVVLTRQQALEEDLSSALLQFRRRATQLGQLEDWHIFNGTYPGGAATPLGAGGPGGDDFLPSSTYLNNLIPGWSLVKGAPDPIADRRTLLRGLLLRDPGTLGLFYGAREVQNIAGRPTITDWYKRGPLTSAGLMSVIVEAMNLLEENGYVAPYACVFGRYPFQAAHQPVGWSVTYPRDRIEPLIGREVLHASALDIVPRPFQRYHWPHQRWWQSRGVLLSLRGEAVDLAIAAEATPEFMYVDVQGRYVFSVFERFTLRIKDSKAIVPLRFN